MSVGSQGATIADCQTEATRSILGEPDAASADSVARDVRARGWDHESRIGLDCLGRVGHVVVQLNLGTIELAQEGVRRLPAEVRDRVPDRPFVEPPDTELEALRAEAEAVLGLLTVPPSRSSGTSPLWSASGDGCSYFTGGHRVLTVKPTLDGPWDDVMQDMYGTLRVLKAEQMLEVVWTISGADQAGALRLASQALRRL